MGLILVIDDDQQLSRSFAKILTQDGYKIEASYTGQDGIIKTAAVNPDLVILDIRLPDMSGMEVFEAIHAENPKLPVIIITAFGTTETAIQAIKQGAYDYIYKPFDVPQMLGLVKKALLAGRCMSSPVDVNPESDGFSGREALVGTSSQMLEVYKAIGRVSSTDATVLIRGESGTGKELAARAVYNHSLRAEKPFMVINCVAIPETLLESELFGYEKGSFTGAAHRRVGKIEQARGGTVFLDEIGDMPMSIQAKFLRLLQENSIERLGGREPISVDVRIIAATNRDLERAVADGVFREDLYYRLQVITITMPPLRDRKGDSVILADYLLARLSAEMSMANPGISPEAVKKIKQYEWPGNIRELANVLKKVLIFNRGAPIQAEEITLNELDNRSRTDDVEATPAGGVRDWVRECLRSEKDEKIFDSCLDHIASLLIEEALDFTEGNRSRAAKLLGMSRPTFHSKLDKYGIRIGTNARE
ncbi:sigma-54 dependent DNA-binding response regulator (NtrC family proten) [Desulforapulum autotrophicum HRM2]|uniref:DNA-binding transcriptional regulator NtrC n=1 Tax=Desulforapulum autotrophicum (strain ATCC 43914 / DSM 3382 / VKM B-1955 / HRM2) TaxID=177437 RepID=C0QC65_DESAH|nr:sigma-54 dependent transcriptional regulator [Desulforapulum autotrophicum]ACN17082.1 sigma-54 dependent DNA-binding response regulator (NtrC family proten) [Desulforapulum autotrophicum HRM2]